jgi:hypothetical protein
MLSDTEPPFTPDSWRKEADPSVASFAPRFAPRGLASRRVVEREGTEGREKGERDLGKEGERGEGVAGRRVAGLNGEMVGRLAATSSKGTRRRSISGRCCWGGQGGV